MIKAGKTYTLSGVVNTKDGVKQVTVTRKVIAINGDTVVFDKDGVPAEGDLATFEKLVAGEALDESAAFGNDCRGGVCE